MKTYKDVKRATRCIIMPAIAYNLKELLCWEQRKIKTAVMAMKKTGKSIWFYFLGLRQHVQADNWAQQNFSFLRSTEKKATKFFQENNFAL